MEIKLHFSGPFLVHQKAAMKQRQPNLVRVDILFIGDFRLDHVDLLELLLHGLDALLLPLFRGHINFNRIDGLVRSPSPTQARLSYRKSIKCSRQKQYSRVAWKNMKSECNYYNKKIDGTRRGSHEIVFHNSRNYSRSWQKEVVPLIFQMLIKQYLQLTGQVCVSFLLTRYHSIIK